MVDRRATRQRCGTRWGALTRWTCPLLEQVPGVPHEDILVGVDDDEAECRDPWREEASPIVGEAEARMAATSFAEPSQNQG